MNSSSIEGINSIIWGQVFHSFPIVIGLLSDSPKNQITSIPMSVFDFFTYVNFFLMFNFLGFGKGLVGAVTRPVSGVVDFASSSFEGIRR